MDALFIGQTYIDVTMLTDFVPSGDEKAVARDYAVSFGGNAVSAGFACAKLGIEPDMIATVADDWLGRMFLDMAQQYKVSVHPRKVRRSSLSFILPNDGKRAILRARDDHYLHPPPNLNIDNCRVLHLDGHQADAALQYAKMCRERGILTSLDGGSLREGLEDLLGYIDVAVVAERLCEQMELDPHEMLDYLKDRGCKIAGVTEGARGMLWYDEQGEISRLPSLPVPPELIIDTSGAGDVFHGAYVASYLYRPDAPWLQHFLFARAASAWKIQHLGNEAGLPTRENIRQMRARYEQQELIPADEAAK